MKQKKSTGGRNTDTIPDSQPGGVTPLPGRVGGPVASRTMPWSRGTARIDAGCRRTARTLSTSTRPLYRSEFRPVVRLPFASRPRASFHLLVARLVHYTHRTTRHIARPYDYDRREYEDRPGTPGKLRATLPPSSARPRTMPWPGAARTSPFLSRAQLVFTSRSEPNTASSHQGLRGIHSADPLAQFQHARLCRLSLARPTRRPNTSLLVMALSHAHTRRSSCVPRDSVRKREGSNQLRRAASLGRLETTEGWREGEQADDAPPRRFRLWRQPAQSLTSKPQRRARARREG